MKRWILNGLICFVAACAILSMWAQADDPPAYYSIPGRSDAQHYLGGSISQVVECGDYVYVLYGNQDHTVQVFDRNGTYRCTWFFIHYRNGGFSLTVEEPFVYAIDERQDVYIFRDGEFVEFMTEADAEERGLELPRFSPRTPEGYVIRDGVVWRTSGGEDVQITQSGSLFLKYCSIAASMLLIAVVAAAFWKKRNELFYRSGSTS